MFGIVKALIRFARKIVEGVLGQLMQQFNVVEEQALAPMRAVIQEITGGVWRGEGANAFVEEVSSLMIPGVGKVATKISNWGNNLRFAQDRIDQADETVSRLVQSRLMDTFKFY